MNKLKLKLLLTTGPIIITSCIIHIYFYFNKQETIKNSIPRQEINLAFNAKNLYDYLDSLNIKNKDIVYKQAILETGYFTSYNFKIRNNLFGFRHNKGYYIYKSWRESVNHYKKWQDKRYKSGDYYKFLNDIGYAEDSLYITKLKTIKFKI